MYIGSTLMNPSSTSALTAARRIPGASLLLVAFTVAASLLPGMAECLQYDRLAVAHGAWWRLLTSHFVHWSLDHLFWDALAFAVLGWMCEREGMGRFLSCVIISAAIIPLCLWLAEPQMKTYRGLSGIDSALFGILAVRMGQGAITDRNWLRLGFICVIAAGFAAKVAFEVVTGSTLFVDSSAAGMIPIPLSHLVGGLVGLVCQSSRLPEGLQ